MSPERVCCHAVAALLTARGITEVIVSPGSRNAPLVDAITSNQDLDTTVVIDERSAAFVALGKALITRRCVVLVCTSGTAMLNYAPALAEAAYRGIPLMAITADRPHEWVNRNDGQTIEQHRAYGSYIKQCFNIDCRDTMQHVSLVINDAITAAATHKQGPVHVNIGIADPTVITVAGEQPDVTFHAIDCFTPSMQLPQDKIAMLASRVQAPARVMIVAGCYSPDQQLNRAISRLCSFGNFICLSDSISNLHGHGIINCPDTMMNAISDRMLDTLRPDIIISHGGAILSTSLKQKIRACNIEHWHVGVTATGQDTFGSMSLRIESSPEVFYRQLAMNVRRSSMSSEYTQRWLEIYNRVIVMTTRLLEETPWCDMTAVNTVMSMTPQSYNIQLSNGMSVRYAQIMPHRHHRVDCNRGVSGIEGSTSTAIGASTSYKGNTLLISGDMSAAYDLNALLLQCKSPRFKMVAIMNGGGGIFNVINGTNRFDMVNEYLVAKQDFPLRDIAIATGFKVFEAINLEQLKKQFKSFLSEDKQPAMIIVRTSAAESARILKDFFKHNKITDYESTRMENN